MDDKDIKEVLKRTHKSGLQDLPDNDMKKAKDRKPYKCPVCGGTGVVPAGFYGKAANETCRTCQGKGIVWE